MPDIDTIDPDTIDVTSPSGVRLLTAGIDVQADRFEIMIVDWGADG